MCTHKLFCFPIAYFCINFKSMKLIQFGAWNKIKYEIQLLHSFSCLIRKASSPPVTHVNCRFDRTNERMYKYCEAKYWSCTLSVERANMKIVYSTWIMFCASSKIAVSQLNNYFASKIFPTTDRFIFVFPFVCFTWFGDSLTYHSIRFFAHQTIYHVILTCSRK